MKILLTHGYFLEGDAREQRLMKPYPPLGILYLAAYLEERGVPVAVFDTTFSTAARLEAHLLETRPDVVGIYVNLMTEDNVRALHRAGCAEVWLGVESGAQAVLDAMDKGITVEHARTALRRLRARGIRVGMFLQFGYPGEGWAEIQATRSLVRELAPDDIGISVS